MRDLSGEWLQTLTGSRVRIMTPGAQTDGAATVIDYVEPPGSVPPAYTRHEFIEVFCVTAGRLAFQFLGEEKFYLCAGQHVTCPSWKPHSFWNETNDPVSVVLMCTPSGLDDFFVEANSLISASAGKSEAIVTAEMAELRQRFGLELLMDAPPSL